MNSTNGVSRNWNEPEMTSVPLHKRANHTIAAMGLALLMLTPPSARLPTASAQAPEVGRRGGILRTVAVEPTTLDPHRSADVGSHGYVIELFSGLVTINPQLRVVPDLAEEWQLSEDGRTYTFVLLPNARFHDGKRVTAADVKYSIERAADPRTRSPVADTYLGDIVGVREKLTGKTAEVEGVRVVDDRTVEITIDDPKIHFLAKLAYPTAFVVDRQNVEGSPDWTQQPNGTGPFKLKEFRADSRVVLARNERFYRNPPLLDEVQFDLSGGAVLRKYENGEIDVHPGVGFADIDRVLDRNGPLWPDLVKDANGNPGIPELSVEYVGFNVQMPPFDDVRVRRAFNHAVDKRLLNQRIMKNLLTPADGILPPAMPGHSSDLDTLTFDPALARRLLSESRYASGMPRIKLSISGAGGASDYVLALVDQWQRNLGVDVEIEQTEWPTFLQDVRDHRYQLFKNGWMADYPDPQNFLDVLFHTKSADNNVGYSNPEVDQLLEQAWMERDVAARLSLYQRAEQIIVTDAAWIPLSFGKSYPLVKPYVKDLSFPAMTVPVYQYAWIDEALRPAQPATRPPTPPARSGPPPAPGTVILADAFDDPTSGWLPQSCSNPRVYVCGYVDGEYVIKKVDPQLDDFWVVGPPGVHADASLAVDVRLVGDTESRFVAISCREQAGNQISEYRLTVVPSTREFKLARWDEDEEVMLVGWRASPPLRRGNGTNRLELSCAGSTIAATINGVEVVSVQDPTYSDGRMTIGFGTFVNARVTAEARFDNLVVTQQ